MVFSPFFSLFFDFKMKYRKFLFAVLVKNLHFKMKQTNYSCYFWFIFIFRNIHFFKFFKNSLLILTHTL